ncbi:MAG: hypothetical protein GWN17_10855 [Candidatus Korarchaeota archaeon]|nr:hypothetical protein [Candidatus Thorarchaeota archaeon]NIW52697.1 hypothetical protein [Candidatus Korarchaeota archaeon]
MERERFEVGEKFRYYGKDVHLHGNIGEVIEVYYPLSPGRKYRCRIEGHRSLKRLPPERMEKLGKKIAWEV